MILDLQEFEEFPAEAEIVAGPNELGPFGDSVIGVEKAKIRLAIQGSAQEYFCQGEVIALVQLECARCLGKFSLEITAETDFIVCSQDDTARSEGVPDDEDYVYFGGNDLRVDIVVPVRQALTLAMPTKPLCAETCRGLCPGCGIDLNKLSCDCRRETVDERWEGLRDLLPEEPDSRKERE